MKNKISIILLFLASISIAGYGPYISPGIMFSWNSSNQITISFKASIGMLYGEEFATGPIYTNVTFGTRAPIRDYTKLPEYKYIEVESGILYVPFGICYGTVGIGLGTAIINKKIYPKGSFFTGGFAFLRSDAIYINNKIDMDIGCMFSVPVPLSENVYPNFNGAFPL